MKELLYQAMAADLLLLELEEQILPQFAEENC